MYRDTLLIIDDSPIDLAILNEVFKPLFQVFGCLPPLFADPCQRRRPLYFPGDALLRSGRSGSSVPGTASFPVRGPA